MKIALVARMREKRGRGEMVEKNLIDTQKRSESSKKEKESEKRDGE